MVAILRKVYGGFCSDPTSDGQISMYKFHPWIGNADTHSTQGCITEFNHTLITLNVSKENYYNNMAEGHLNTITAEASKVEESIQLHGKTECMTTT